MYCRVTQVQLRVSRQQVHIKDATEYRPPNPHRGDCPDLTGREHIEREDFRVWSLHCIAWSCLEREEGSADIGDLQVQSPATHAPV